MAFIPIKFLLARWLKPFGDSGVVAIAAAEAKNLTLTVIDSFQGLHGLSGTLHAIPDGNIIASVVIALFVVRILKGHDPPPPNAPIDD